MKIRKPGKAATRHADAAQTAMDKDFSHVEVAPHEAEPAYVGAPVIEAGKLLTPEESVQSQKTIDKRDTTSTVRLVLMLNLASFMAAVSYAFFAAPNHLVIGGASGLSILLSSLIPGLSQSIALWAVNIVCVTVGLFFLDRKTVIWSMVSSLAISAYATLLQGVFSVQGSLTGDLWIDLLCTVILTAVAAAMAFSVGTTTGGMDIIISAVAKHTTLTPGNATMVINAATVLGGIALYGLRTGLYCVVGLLIVTMVVNYVLDTMKQHKIVTVICKHPAMVEEFIVRELYRTATISQAYGAYSGNTVTPIMTVLNPRETLKLEQYVRSVDPNAFITYVNTSQITGKGFRLV